MRRHLLVLLPLLLGAGTAAAGTPSAQAARSDRRLLGFIATKKQRFPSLGGLRTDKGTPVPAHEVEDFVLVPEAKTARFSLRRDWLAAPYGAALAGAAYLGFEPAMSALARGDLHGAGTLAASTAAVAVGYHLGDMGLRVGHSIFDGYTEGKTAAPFVNHHAAVGDQAAWSPMQVASLYFPRALAMGALSFGALHLGLSHGFDPEIAAATFGGMTAWVSGNLFHRDAHRDWEQEEARAKGEPLPFAERSPIGKGFLSLARKTGFAMTPDWHKKHHGDGTKRFGTASQLADNLYDPVFARAVTLVARATANRSGGPVIHRAFLENKKWLMKNEPLMVRYLKAHPELATTASALAGPAGLALPYSVPTRFAQILGIHPSRLPEVVAFLGGDHAALSGDGDAELRRRLTEGASDASTRSR